MTDTDFSRKGQAKRLSPEEAQSIFAQANKLTRLRRYEEAIPILELFCTQTDETYPNHYQAKMLLVKAYQHHHILEKAIALCQELLNSNHNVAQLWARNYLPTIAPEPVQPEPKPAEDQEKDWKLPKRSLEDFKDFCRQNLIENLQEIEGTRKEILRVLTGSIIVFALIFGLTVNFTVSSIQTMVTANQKYCDSTGKEVMERRDSKGDLLSNNPEWRKAELERRQKASEIKRRVLDKCRAYYDSEITTENITSQPCTSSNTTRQASFECRIYDTPETTTEKKIDQPQVYLSLAQDGIGVLLLALVVINLLFVIWIAFYSSSTETYGRGFQRIIIEKIINFLDPKRNLTYFKVGDDDAVLYALQQSRLFRNVNRSTYLKQDHYIAGRISQIDISFAEITLQKEVPLTWMTVILDFVGGFARLGGTVLPIPTLIFLILSIVRGTPYCLSRIAKGQRIDFEHFRTEIVLNAVSHQSIFKGIFFTSEFNKSFRGKTIILPKKLTSKVKFLNQHHGQPVKLEDPEFNKFFAVYSNDQVGARYVLSTSMMRRIVDFRKKANRDILISLVDSQLYIGVPSEEDLFEPRLFKTMLSFNPMREYFETLQLMMSIVEDLNLNQRIWKL